EEAEKGLTRIYETLSRVDEALKLLSPHSSGAQSSELKARTRFVEAMDDDCNTARVLGVVFDTIREMNRTLDAGQTAELGSMRAELAALASVLGILNENPAQFLEEQKRRGLAQSQLTPEKIEQLIAERASARKAKDFKRGDAIRADLEAQGVILKDSPT